jgi:DNA-binding MarR family transcriptional regulator
MMVTTGAITNRIDRLEQRGFVERGTAPDRRKVVVRLTANGLQIVDQVIVDHLDVEREIVAVLSERQRRDLARMLRAALIALGDSG